jgi:hypothetical protein
MVGDVYVIENPDHAGYYTTGKVAEVKTDSVSFFVSVNWVDAGPQLKKTAHP